MNFQKIVTQSYAVQPMVTYLSTMARPAMNRRATEQRPINLCRMQAIFLPSGYGACGARRARFSRIHPALLSSRGIHPPAGKHAAASVH